MRSTKSHTAHAQLSRGAMHDWLKMAIICSNRLVLINDVNAKTSTIWICICVTQKEKKKKRKNRNSERVRRSKKNMINREPTRTMIHNVCKWQRCRNAAFSLLTAFCNRCALWLWGGLKNAYSWLPWFVQIRQRQKREMFRFGLIWDVQYRQ